MTIFKPKKGSIWQKSRVAHLLLAATLTWYGGHEWGYQGSILTGLGAILMGFGWEVSNRFTKGVHPYGDALDFWAFVVGAALSGIYWVVWP